ncbi:hypothetical protein GGF43_003479 [Coemansia sp. RSA 2618]|nr:hypothetical protein GGF43_003479 [Coemansia sp. RSA 2618]
MSDKKNLNWEISVLEAQTGSGKSLWKAKAKETRRQREKTKRAKQTAKATNSDPAATTIDSNDTEDAEARLQELRKEKVTRKLHAIQKRSKTLVSKLVQFEQQRLKRKIQDVQKTRAKLIEEQYSEYQDKQRLAYEAIIREHQEDVETTKGLPVEGLVECMLFRIKKRSPVLFKALDVPALSPELQELNSSKCVQRVLGAKQATDFIKTNSTGLTDVLAGTKSRDSKQTKPREEPTARGAKPAPKQPRASQYEDDEPDAPYFSGSDGYESTSDLDADPTSRFIGRLDGNVSDASMGDHDDSRARKSGKNGKRQRDPDEYDEVDDKDFMKIYHGKDGKKNRPGQRQRRRQHEREFGSDANHVKLLEREKPRGNPGQQRRQHAAGAEQSKGSKPALSAKDQTMHPSWEAKRRERELLEQAKTIKGQKIVFS